MLWLSAAQAETSPYFVGARQTLTRDSNVDRTEVATSDTISSTGIFAGIDQTFGRQHLSGEIDANVNRYNKVKRLNNTDGTADLRLDWATIGLISGEAELKHTQGLYRYDLSVTATVPEKVIVKNSTARLQARLGVVTDWTFEGGVEDNRRNYSVDMLSNNNLDQRSYNVGVRYRPSTLWNIGLSTRRTNGKYPDARNALGDPADNEFRRNDVNLSASWSPTGNSTLSGRIGHSRLNYSVADARDTSLLTGTLSYHWRAGGRLSIDTSLVRDSDAGQSSTDVPAFGELINYVSADTRVANTLLVRAQYELTSKILLSFEAREMRRNLDNALTSTLLGNSVTTLRQASDNTRGLGLSVSYDLLRSVRLSCSVNHAKRTIEDSNPLAQRLTYPYNSYTANCGAEVSLRP